jgi:hypothetical protein
MFNANVSNGTATTNRGQFTINIDGGTVSTMYHASAKVETGGNGGSISMMFRSAAQTAASHTVKIQWASIDAGTFYANFKSLIVMEEAA